MSVFTRLNQIIISYHVNTTGTIVLNEKHDKYKLLTENELENWEFGEGSIPAIKHWLSL